MEVMNEKKELKIHECKRCGHSWGSRMPRDPICCAGCKSPYWKEPRK